MVIMIEPYPGYIGYPIYRFSHTKNNSQTILAIQPQVLGDANNGLVISFERDVKYLTENLTNLE